MKIFPVLILLFIQQLSLAQSTLPNSFKIGDYVEVYGNDSMKVYFGCTGAVVRKKCAAYYRVGTIDAQLINFAGDFTDYYASGEVALKATIINNQLHGSATYFYSSGSKKEEGKYLNNIREGKWTFYYPNGEVEKVYNYAKGESSVVEAYSAVGDKVVSKGKGMISTTFSNDLQCEQYVATGPVINGKMTDNWKFSKLNDSSIISIETFDRGKFIKGVSNDFEYRDKPIIRLSQFYPNENLNLVASFNSCKGENSPLLSYDSASLIISFYPELQNKLSMYQEGLKNQWIVVGIDISETNKVENINISSSVDDQKVEFFLYNLLIRMNKWTTEFPLNTKVKSSIYFSILAIDGIMIIPKNFIYQ